MRLPILLLAACACAPLVAADGTPRGDGAHRGEARERVLARFDADHDGTLSPTERAAAKAAWQQRREGGGKAGTGGERRGKLIARFDTDKDGKLDETERAAAKTALAAREAELKQNHPKAFARLDRDGDGDLERGELRGQRGDRGRADRAR